MTSLASTLHEMVGNLREELFHVVVPESTPLAVEAARARLAEIATLGATSSAIFRATEHVDEAIDRILEVKEEATQAGSPLDAEQTSHAVNLVEDPLSELAHAVNALP